MKDVFEKYKEQFYDALHQLKTKGTRKKQIPNILTASRLMSPFIILPSIITGNFILAGISIFVFSATDLVDGYLARKFEATSDFGKDLDAVTDKIFVGTLLASLVFINPIYSIPLILEGKIAAININKKLDNKDPKSHMIGKVKMTSLYIMIASCFANMYIPIPPIIMESLYIGTVGLQVLTTYTYSKENRINYSEDIESKKILINNEEPENGIEQHEKSLTSIRLEKYKTYKKYLEEQIKLKEADEIEMKPKQNIKK